MRKILLCLCAILSNSLFISCEAQTHLPAKIPPDIQIIYTSEGGFQPTFYRIIISENTIKVKDQSPETDNKELIWDAEITNDELNNLYKVFIANKFDSIRPNNDAGADDSKTRSIELKFDKNHYKALSGDGVTATKINEERFKNIENAIEKLVENKRNKTGK